MLEHEERLDCLRTLPRLFFAGPGQRALNEVNRALAGRPVLAYISPMPRRELIARARLYSPFPLFELEDRGGNRFTAALGREAILLESLGMGHWTRGKGQAFIV